MSLLLSSSLNREIEVPCVMTSLSKNTQVVKPELGSKATVPTNKVFHLMASDSFPLLTLRNKDLAATLHRLELVLKS